MTLRVVSGAGDLRAAVRTTQRHLAAQGERKHRNVGTQGGSGSLPIIWHAAQGYWSHVRPARGSERAWLMFGAALTALATFMLLCACSTTNAEGTAAMPPGDWIGRCKQSTLAAASARSTVPTKWVDDQANILSPAFEADLARVLAAYHAATCHQMSVIVVESLEGRKVEDYSLAHANALGLGYRRFNNGVMLLVAPNDRAARIEVGCGLEDVISDAQAADIMGRDLVPAFRTGDFEGGIRAGVSALAALARRKAIPSAFRPAACAAH